MYTFLCEDSIDGVFSGIYEAWAGHYDRRQIVLRTAPIYNYELFMEYQNIANNPENGQKVGRTLRRQFGEEVYEIICYALWSQGEDKANAVYQMVRYGIENHCGSELAEHLTNPYIQRVNELWQASYNEAHHYHGFVRFSELENGMLYSAIEAKNDVLEPLAAHFTERIPGENWAICDKNRRKAVIHQAYGGWILVQEQAIEKLINCRRTETDEEFRSMWRLFCTSVSIEARENQLLQRQNLPLRFRKYMV